MIIAYLFLVLLVGLYNYKTSSSNDYLFASRKLTLPSFIATLVTTWYGSILVIGDYTYQNGIVTWVAFGLFYDTGNEHAFFDESVSKLIGVIVFYIAK